MIAFAVGDQVQWDTCNSPERGTIEEIVGPDARVSYGPWHDEMWIPLSRLILWRA